MIFEAVEEYNIEENEKTYYGGMKLLMVWNGSHYCVTMGKKTDTSKKIYDTSLGTMKKFKTKEEAKNYLEVLAKKFKI